MSNPSVDPQPPEQPVADPWNSDRPDSPAMATPSQWDDPGQASAPDAGPERYPAAGQPAYPSFTQPGYAPAGQPGYPPAGQPGYQGAGEPGYAAAGQSGYPIAGQPAYPAAGQPGYPIAGQPGYPPPGQPGYPPAGQPGYPPPGQPAAAAPVTAKKSKVGLFVRLGIAAALILTGAVFAMMQFNPKAASVGDCLAADGEESVKSTQCGSPDAAYQVVAVFPDVDRPLGLTANPCEAIAEATTTYWEGRSGGKGTLLCLKDV